MAVLDPAAARLRFSKASSRPFAVSFLISLERVPTWGLDREGRR